MQPVSKCIDCEKLNVGEITKIVTAIHNKTLTCELKYTKIMKTYKCNVLFVITHFVGRGLLDKQINCNKVILVNFGFIICML